MKTIAAILSLLAVLGVTGGLLVSSHIGNADDVEKVEAALPVNVVAVQPVSSVTREREFTGSVIAARRTRLAFERPARLVEAVVDEGDDVAEGQVLARIDQRQLRTQRSELNARLKQQKAILAELISGPRRETIAATQAELAARAADVELRKATFDRSQNLFNRKGTSAQELDEVRLAWKSAAARQDALQRQLDELEAGTRVEQLEAQKALIDGIEAQLERLDIDITDSELKAPFSGTVIKRFGDEGDLLSAQQPLFEILETGRLEARIGVPSRLIASLADREYFVLTANELEFTGQLRNVVAQVDPATRTQTVVISIDDSFPDGIADGQLVRMKVNEKVEANGFQVPVTALASGSRGLWNVYAVEDDADSGTVVRNRVVEVLHTDGEQAIVRGALYEGERIVVDGIHRVVPGQTVVPNSSAFAEQE